MREALHAEWTKVRTTPGTFWALLAIAVLIAGAGATVAAGTTCPPGGCSQDPARLLLIGTLPGQAVVVVFAALTMSGEYGTGMIQYSLTAVPRRTAVLAAKAVVVVGLVLPAAAAGVFGAVLSGRALLPAGPFAGQPLPSPTDGPMLRATLGSIAYLVLIAMLSLGLATLVRDSAAAIGGGLGLLFVFPIVAGVVGDPIWRKHLQQIGPMSAGLAVQATTRLDALPIGPWAGLAVLGAWAGAAMLAGGLALGRRDA